MAGTITINQAGCWGMVEGYFVDHPITPALLFNYRLFESRAAYESWHPISGGGGQHLKASGRFGIVGPSPMVVPFANGIAKADGHALVKKLLSESLTESELAATHGVEQARQAMLGAEMDLDEDGQDVWTVTALEVTPDE